MSDRVKVLFIAGTGRTGSTLLGNLLGSMSGVFSVGELRHFWRRGLWEDWSCGCGRPFHSCPFWRQVVSALGKPSKPDLDRLLGAERDLLRLRNSWRAPRWLEEGAPAFQGDQTNYSASVKRLYRVVSQVADAEFIADSSKTPSYAAILASMPDAIDLRVIHLLRDPRATAYSWLHPKPSLDRGSGGVMDRVGAAKSAVLWSWWNRLAESIWRASPDTPVARVRYEDLIADPSGVLAGALGIIAPELDPASLPLWGRAVALAQAHTVSGNPGRMLSGEIDLTADERWRRGLSPPQRAVVSLIGGPSMRRYGYWRRDHADEAEV